MPSEHTSGLKDGPITSDDVYESYATQQPDGHRVYFAWQKCYSLIGSPYYDDQLAVLIGVERADGNARGGYICRYSTRTYVPLKHSNMLTFHTCKYIDATSHT